MRIKVKCIIENLKIFFPVILFVSFLFLGSYWRNIFEIILKANFQLSPSSTLYNMWVKNPIPIYLEIYLFNFTNGEEFRKNKTVKPNFKEIGPFVFEENRDKVDIVWNEFRETVTFNQTKQWKFIPEISQDLSSKITNLNPIASTIAHMSRLWNSPLQRQIANTLLNLHEPLISTASAKEWIFDGIPDEFLKIFEVIRKVTEIPIPYNKFGWFYDRNMSSSYDGIFEIRTGKSNVYELGSMASWNGLTQTEHYVDDCALVRGISGEIIPPLRPHQQSLEVFASDICSYVTLKYKGIKNVEGVNGYEYAGDESLFDNGTFHPENLCFYVGESSPSGTRNVSSCRFGSPAFISYPHFYLADPIYLEKLTGLHPDESKHRFSLKVEPKTGVPLSVDGSFQINFRIQSYPWCDEFREAPEIYVPMLWFKETAKLSKSYAIMINFLLATGSYGSFLFFFMSGFVLLSYGALFLFKK